MEPQQERGAIMTYDNTATALNLGAQAYGCVHEQRQRFPLDLTSVEEVCDDALRAWYPLRKTVDGCKQAFEYSPCLTGLWRLYRTADALCVALSVLRLRERLSVRTRGDGLVTIRVVLTGHSRFSSDEVGPLDMNGPLVTVFRHTQDEPLLHEIAGGAQRVLTLVACPEFLQDELGWALDEMTSPVPLPLTPAVEKIARDMLQNRFDGARHETFVRARTLDLLCMLATEWDSAAPSDGEAVVLTVHDRERIHRLRATLEEMAHHPPSIAQSARMAGMNKTKLMRGFKQLFGETIADFCRRMRLEEARTMLLAERRSIAEIAMAVGYQHQSSFTTAFSAHFGIPPKALLRTASAGNGPC
jgi:AraC-like DNA-binding protein